MRFLFFREIKTGCFAIGFAEDLRKFLPVWQLFIFSGTEKAWPCYELWHSLSNLGLTNKMGMSADRRSGEVWVKSPISPLFARGSTIEQWRYLNQRFRTLLHSSRAPNRRFGLGRNVCARLCIRIHGVRTVAQSERFSFKLRWWKDFRLYVWKKISNASLSPNA